MAKNELVVFIPLEIVEKIVINLPVKSLLRFKGVSKTWRSLISEPGFIRKHLNHASQPENVSQKTLIIGNEGQFYPINFCCFPLSTLQPPQHLRCPFPHEHSYYWLLVGSCDGLLCLWISDSVYIWNPCLANNAAYTRVSSPTGAPNFMHYWCVNLNFGYDSTADDYKLLMLSRALDSHAIETRVYSLRSESWTRHEDYPGYVYASWPGRSVFVNGSFHWIGLPIDYPDKPALFSFHLSDGKYGEAVRLTELHLQSNSVVETCLLEGMLGVVIKLESSHLLVWVMKDFFHGSREWSKILDITVDDDFLGGKDVRPFFMGENGEVKMGVFSRERCLWKPPGIGNARSSMFVHVESMISPVSSVGHAAAAAAAILTDLPDGDNKDDGRNVFFQLLTQDKYVHNL